MAQLNCPTCHPQDRCSWDWNRSQMNLNAVPTPWTGLAAGNPWHGSIIIPPATAFPMAPANDDFVRRGSFNSQPSGRHQRHQPKFHHHRRAEPPDEDSDLSFSDDRRSSRGCRSPHATRAASPALSRRSRRTVVSDSEDDFVARGKPKVRGGKRRTNAAAGQPSPASSRAGYARKKYNRGDDDDAMSAKSVGSRRSVKSARSYLQQPTNRRSTSDSDDELTSDREASGAQITAAPCAAPTARPGPDIPMEVVEKERRGPIVGDKDWECEHCTYLNWKESAVCEVCCKTRTPKEDSQAATKNADDALEKSMGNMRISMKGGNDSINKGNEKSVEISVKSISTGTSPPPQTISTQTYDIPQYPGKRNRSLSCDDYSDWNPAKKTNSILSSNSDKQSSFQQDSSQSTEYIHALLQNHVKHGAEIVKLLKEAELHHFELEDVTAALAQCGDENPIKWLLENWNRMIDTVVTLATNYGRELPENTIGTISSMEAQAALRMHNGDIWAAVTECIRQRQSKYAKLMSKGLYSREDVVTVLTANHGDLEAAYKELSKSQRRPLLLKIWGPPQGLDNECGNISDQQYKDYECDMDQVGLPSDNKQNFDRIQSWLDTTANSQKEFDEFLDFEEVLNSLKMQPKPTELIRSPFSSHVWKSPRNLVTLQNEKLTRYNSCDNLKNHFDSILSRKKIYASTEILTMIKQENEKNKPRLEQFSSNKQIDQDRRSNLYEFQNPNKFHSYLLINKSPEFGLTQQMMNTSIPQNGFQPEAELKYSSSLLNEDLESKSTLNSRVVSNNYIPEVNNVKNDPMIDLVADKNDNLTKNSRLSEILTDESTFGCIAENLIQSAEKEFTNSKSNQLHFVSYSSSLTSSVESFHSLSTIQIPKLENEENSNNKTQIPKLENEENSNNKSIINSESLFGNKESIDPHLVRPERKSSVTNLENQNEDEFTAEMFPQSEENGSINKKIGNVIVENTEKEGSFLEIQPKIEKMDLLIRNWQEKIEVSSTESNQDDINQVEINKNLIMKHKKVPNSTKSIKKIEKYSTGGIIQQIIKKLENSNSEKSVENIINETDLKFLDFRNRSKKNLLEHSVNFPKNPNTGYFHNSEDEKMNSSNKNSLKCENISTKFSSSNEKIIRPENMLLPNKEPENISDNSILLPELNALYQLAKCNLDYHIIEMKETPFHTTFSKIFINDLTNNLTIVEEFDKKQKHINTESEIKPFHLQSAAYDSGSDKNRSNFSDNFQSKMPKKIEKYVEEANDQVNEDQKQIELTLDDDKSKNCNIESSIDIDESEKSISDEINQTQDGEATDENFEDCEENVVGKNFVPSEKDYGGKLLQIIDSSSNQCESSIVSEKDTIDLDASIISDEFTVMKNTKPAKQNEVHESSAPLIEDSGPEFNEIENLPHSKEEKLLEQLQQESDRNQKMSPSEINIKVESTINEEGIAILTKNPITLNNYSELIGSTNHLNELNQQFQPVKTAESEVLLDIIEVTRENSENGESENLSNLQVEARHFLTEGVVSTFDQAELVAQLMELKFDRSQSIDAANECPNIYSAIAYLQQECQLCAEKFSMKQMISMLECEHKCCQECARQFFSLQINEKSIEHCVCPFCETPDLSELNSDEVFNYFSNLDILLKTILEPQTHELFQQKLRDRTLMQDPSFKWCAKCSFGFIADLDQKRLSCPLCKAISCASCGKLWTKEHNGKSCEQYNKWLATQNDSTNQFVNYLEENGISCPKCDTKFILVKGGCMHLTCSRCKYEFCSDCLKPFSMGTDCKLSEYCAKLGLHAHHPRNCLFYLRDKEPGELKQLLIENNIEINLQNTSEKRCNVQLQRETDDGLRDMKCNAQVEEGGLCKTHYIEFLASLIKKNKLDPVNILDLAEILQEFRRQGKSLPIRSANSFEHEYRKHCIKVVSEEIPLT